jgi:hypothetical protein
MKGVCEKVVTVSVFDTGKEERMIGKGLATIASGCICGYLLFISKGEHGIGWFILSLFLIWF